MTGNPMRHSMLLLTLGSVLAAADSIPPEDANFHDIRLIFCGLPKSVDTHLENKSTRASFDSKDTIDSDTEISIGYQFNHYHEKVGVLVGVNLDVITTKDQANGITDNTSNVGPSLHLGVGVRPVDYFNFEGLIFGGLGSSQEEVKGAFTKDISSDSGMYTQIGVELRAVFTMGPGFQIFLQAGYISLRQTLKYNRDTSINLAELEITNKISGGTYGLGAGWRF